MILNSSNMQSCSLPREKGPAYTAPKRAKRKSDRKPASAEPRPTCFTCFRPFTHCVCNLITPFSAHYNILILQHPNERDKYYSTAKLIRTGIKNARILRGIEFKPGVLERALEGQSPYILFPSAEAKDCETTALEPNATVIAIDGTWAEAGKILFRNPILKTFPCLTFTKPFRSQYKIRKQPRDYCLSTLESIGHLLQLSAAQAGCEQTRYAPLFEGFQKMIAQQLAHIPEIRD